MRKPLQTALGKNGGLFRRFQPLSLVLDHVFTMLIHPGATLDWRSSRGVEQSEQRLVARPDETVEVIRGYQGWLGEVPA